MWVNADFEQDPGYSEHELKQIVKLNDTELLEQVLEQQPHYIQSAIYYAIEHGNIALMYFLSVYYSCAINDTCINYAVIYDQLYIMEYILEHNLYPKEYVSMKFPLRTGKLNFIRLYMGYKIRANYDDILYVLKYGYAEAAEIIMKTHEIPENALLTTILSNYNSSTKEQIVKMLMVNSAPLTKNDIYNIVHTENFWALKIIQPYMPSFKFYEQISSRHTDDDTKLILWTT